MPMPFGRLRIVVEAIGETPLKLTICMCERAATLVRAPPLVRKIWVISHIESTAAVTYRTYAFWNIYLNGCVTRF